MESKKYVEFTDDVRWCIENNMPSWELDNLKYVEIGTANWKLVEDGENHAWACEHCGHIGGRGWDEPKYKYCGSCGFRMERRQ